MRRIRWQWKPSGRVRRVLSAVPFLLLAFVAAAIVDGLALDIVDIEPFDAWTIGFAGMASAVIAVIGIGASIFSPMAYCRYGCPTGSLLQFLRLERAQHDCCMLLHVKKYSVARTVVCARSC